MSAAPKVLIVGDFPPPYGGVAVHVEVLRLAVRSRGGECTVLDIGKGQLPADGVVPAAGYARVCGSADGSAMRRTLSLNGPVALITTRAAAARSSPLSRSRTWSSLARTGPSERCRR